MTLELRALVSTAALAVHELIEGGLYDLSERIALSKLLHALANLGELDEPHDLDEIQRACAFAHSVLTEAGSGRSCSSTLLKLFQSI